MAAVDLPLSGTALFAAAATVHLSFQWIVHVVVYPGLADASRTVPARSAELHGRYTGRMALAVAPVYGLLVTGAGALAVDPPPGGSGVALVAAALASTVATLALTGWGAVPVHRRLSGSPAPASLARRHARLRSVDRVRLTVAALQVGVAVGAVLVT